MIQGSLPKMIIAATMGFLLVACGGGGGSGSDSSLVGGDGGTGTGGDTETGTPTITLSVVNDTGGAVTRISGNETVTAEATVLDGSGTPVSGIVVSYSTTIGQLSPSSGTALTNSQGIAEVTLSAGTTSGAGTVSATATVDNTTISSNQVGVETDAEATGGTVDDDVEGLQLGTCTVGTGPTDCTSDTTTTFSQGTVSLSSSQISAGGTATVELVVVDVNIDPISGAEISFTTNCASRNDAITNEPLASITDTAITNSIGVVSANYQANGCEGNDTITAREAGTGETATGTINVLSPIIGSIRFVSVSEENIQIKGTGDSTAVVTFELLDVQGEPVADEEVQFGLTTDVGGLALSRTAGKTDDNGEVTTIVNAGFIPTTVRVRASLEVDTDSPPDGVNDTTLETLSDQLSINTGIADQDSMSVSATTLNIEGDQFDGVTTTLTVRMSDKFNNPVFDGTAVAWRTELGSITPSCNTTGGACAVTLTSQEPRSPLDPNVEYNTLFDDACPTAFIYEETVTISGSDGDTDYLVDDVHRVETPADIDLIEDVDYTVDDDGSGITCEAGSVTCADTLPVKITYDRAWLDEEGDGTGGTHPIPNPGVATAPFTSISGVPCPAAFRERDQGASAFYGGMGQLYGGRSTVLLYAQGEESFIDSNANGQYDWNEPFVDLTEAFLDVNEDGVYGNPDSSGEIRTTANPNCYGPASPIRNVNTPQDEICYQIGGDEEEFVDFDALGSFNEGNGIYNGTLCPKEVSDRTDSALSCNNADDPCTATDQYCTRTLLHIRQEIPILLAGSVAYMGVRDWVTGEYIAAVDLNGTTGTFTAGVGVEANNGVIIPAGTEFTVGHGDNQVRPGIGETVFLTSGSGSVLVDISDHYNGVMPAGTGIAVTSGTDGCAIQNSPGTSVPSSSGLGYTQIFISLGQPENPPTGTAPVTIGVSTELADETSNNFSCSH